MWPRGNFLEVPVMKKTMGTWLDLRSLVEGHSACELPSEEIQVGWDLCRRAS